MASRPLTPTTIPVMVTKIIGEVTLDDDSALTTHEAAFVLIAQQDEPGNYSFPLSDGGTCEVNVEYTHSD